MNRTREASLRVIVASEDPELGNQITRLVEREHGVKVVEQVHNAVEAVARARALRPEATLVDPYLPYRFGVDGVPLSRMSGLDVALGVAEELPGSTAILLSSADAPLSWPYSPDAKAELCRYTDGFCVPLSLRQLQLETTPNERVVFANVWAEETPPPGSKAIELSDKLLVWGAIALVVGFGLVLTWILAIPGVALGGGGLVAVLLGFAIKGAVKCFPGLACQSDTSEEPERGWKHGTQTSAQDMPGF